MREIRVASYNVHRCIGVDRRHDPDRVAGVLRELGADVIALQELDFRFHVPDGPDQLAFLARVTGMTPVAGPVRTNGLGHYGNGLLTKGEVVSARQIELSEPGREPRGALDVQVSLRGRRIRLVAAHLGLGVVERRRQVKRLLRALREDDLHPLILLGDFNEWLPPGRPLRRLHRHMGRAPAGRTFPSPFPLLALDRIWVSPREALLDLQVHATRAARIASDHLPVRASIDPHAADARRRPIRHAH